VVLLPEIKNAADPLREVEVVGHGNEGDFLFLLDLEEEVGDLGAGFAIEGTGGFVG